MSFFVVVLGIADGERSEMKVGFFAESFQSGFVEAVCVGLVGILLVVDRYRGVYDFILY